MDLQEAIEYIKDCRETHIDAVNYLDAGYTIWDWIKESGSIEEALGTLEFHQECVDDYSAVIAALEEALDEKTTETR